MSQRPLKRNTKISAFLMELPFFSFSLTSLSIPNREIDSIEFLPKMPNLLVVDISNNPIADLTPLSNCLAFENIHFTINRRNFRTAFLLRRLSIVECKLNYDGIGASLELENSLSALLTRLYFAQRPD